MRLVLAFAFLVSLAVARPAAAAECADGDGACQREVLRRHAVQQAAFWSPMLQRPRADRIRPAPPELVDYLQLDNRFNGFPERPRPAAPDPAFLADLQRAADSIPARVWDLAAPGLAGILLVDHLGSTGFTSAVRDARGHAVAAYVVLDAGLLAGLDGNGWASWKEHTPFRRDGLHRLQVRIETDAANGREAAIRYILLHELGHVVGLLHGVLPDWDTRTLPASLARYPFLQASWSADSKGHPMPREGQGFAQRSDVVYYLGARLGMADAAPVYRQLARTSFPTLYAATNPWDDFAESFANYVHVVLLRKPWDVQVRGIGDDVESFGPCWDSPRCEAKQRVLRALLGG